MSRRRPIVQIESRWKEMGRSADGRTVHRRLELTGKFFLHAHERDGVYTAELAGPTGKRTHMRGQATDPLRVEMWALIAARNERSRLLRVAHGGRR
jgi:hypothetical protein